MSAAAIARRLFDQQSESSLEGSANHEENESTISASCHAAATRTPPLVGRPASSSARFRFGIPADERTVSRTRSASYRVPSDTESDNEDEVQSAYVTSLPRPTPLEEMLHDRNEQKKRDVTNGALKRHDDLRKQVEEIEKQLAEGIQLASKEIKAKQAALEAKEQAALRQHSQQRDERLAQLAARHQQAAAAQRQHVARLQDEAKRKAEEAARQEALRKAEEARKAAEAAEQQRKAEAEKAAAEERAKQEQAAKQQQLQQQQQQQQQAAESSAQAARAASGTAASTSGQPAAGQSQTQSKALRIAASAAAAEKKLDDTLAAAEALVEQFATNDTYKKQRRDIEKSITKFVQQIAASQQQVSAKSQDLQRVLQSCPDDTSRTYASLVLAKKLLSQAEVQVLRLPSFAFPLAIVAVNVASVYPPFMEHFCARLHRACILTVPKYYVFVSGMSEDEYFTKMGYKEVEAKAGGTSWEITDDFASRVQGYMLLYGAITQVDLPGNPIPVSHAWTFLAQLLNALPANRITATALEAFLKAAGYRLHQAYRAQFVKMLKYIDAVFLAELASSKSSEDAQAVSVRLRTYCHVGSFQKPPEGSQMPEFDEASYIRA